MTDARCLTLDHVIPLAMGGGSTVENLQPLCKWCNAKKADRAIDYRPGMYLPGKEPR